MSVGWKNKQNKLCLGHLKRIKLQGTPAMQTTIRSRQVSCEQGKEKRKLLRGETEPIGEALTRSVNTIH